MAKRRRMTVREKEERARIKKMLQEEGALPPDKPRLNRKKYVEEAKQEWNERDRLAWDIYLYEAISIMLGTTDRKLRVTQEAIGVAKCLKLAIRLKEFYGKIRSEGRMEYTIKEQIEFIRDILDA